MTIQLFRFCDNHHPNAPIHHERFYLLLKFRRPLSPFCDTPSTESIRGPDKCESTAQNNAPYTNCIPDKVPFLGSFEKFMQVYIFHLPVKRIFQNSMLKLKEVRDADFVLV
jgi:hypothetical protein